LFYGKDASEAIFTLKTCGVKQINKGKAINAKNTTKKAEYGIYLYLPHHSRHACYERRKPAAKTRDNDNYHILKKTIPFRSKKGPEKRKRRTKKESKTYKPVPPTIMMIVFLFQMPKSILRDSARLRSVSSLARFSASPFTAASTRSRLRFVSASFGESLSAAPKYVPRGRRLSSRYNQCPYCCRPHKERVSTRRDSC